MASSLETVILNLQEVGFFQFILPFLLTSAVFYGLLRKSRLFGEPGQNMAVNSMVALGAAFFVWAYPILAGVDVETQFAKFMFQSLVALIVFMVGLMIVGMIYPEDLSKKIAEILKGPKSLGIVMVVGLLVAVAIVISSGLIGFAFPQVNFNVSGGGSVLLDSDSILTLAVVIILAGSVGLIVWATGPKKS